MTREDVVQSALKVERWCRHNCVIGSWKREEGCDCPFYDRSGNYRTLKCALQATFFPHEWDLEEWLRARGLKNGSV